jgi:hypothetical protein
VYSSKSMLYESTTNVTPSSSLSVASPPAGVGTVDDAGGEVDVGAPLTKKRPNAPMGPAPAPAPGVIAGARDLCLRGAGCGRWCCRCCCCC